MDSHAQAVQRKSLKTLFYLEFDRSLADRWLAWSDSELESHGQLLGRGTHFSAYRFGGLVFKRAHPGTFKRGALTLRVWLSALEKAKGLGGLMPPFELVATGETPALVMPYGAQPLAQAGVAWQPIAAVVKGFEGELERAGLVLDDVFQGRCREGVPFLVDLSDLKGR